LKTKVNYLYVSHEWKDSIEKAETKLISVSEKQNSDIQLKE